MTALRHRASSTTLVNGTNVFIQAPVSTCYDSTSSTLTTRPNGERFDSLTNVDYFTTICLICCLAEAEN